MKTLLILLASLAGLFLFLKLISTIRAKRARAQLQSKLKSQKVPKKEYFVPSAEDLGKVDVKVCLHPVTQPFPLPLKEKDIWFISRWDDPEMDEIYTLKYALEDKGYDFRYYNEVFEDLTPEVIAYNFPSFNPDTDVVSRERFTKAVTEGLGIDFKENSFLFVRYSGKTDPTLSAPSGQDAFEVFTDVATNPKDLLIKGFAYIETLKDLGYHSHDGEVCFSIGSSTMPSGNILNEAQPPTPDEIFDKELEKVANETYSSLSRLIMSGYSIEVFEGWLKKLSAPSRVVITRDYRILLPDYNNMEIKMTQLPKTVFLFFLWFDTRCAIHQLQRHRDIFLAIYRKLTIFDEPQTMEESIDRLVASDGRSFMEKCSAVKKAFLAKMSDRQAINYYIHGRQGYSKGIDLDRQLVAWETPLFPNKTLSARASI